MGMNIDQVLRTLPVTRINQMQGHPETYHLRVLYHMAARCGPRPLLVEYGVSNGSVALVLRAGAEEGADVVIVGAYPEHLQSWIDNGFIRHVPSLKDLAVSPTLIWVGAPEAAADMEAVLALNPKVICLYDIYAAPVFHLEQFASNAQAAALLRHYPGRQWNELSRKVHVQNTARGLLISEALQWQRQRLEAPPALLVASEEEPAALLPEPEETASIPVVRPKAVFQRRQPQIDLANETPGA